PLLRSSLFPYTTLFRSKAMQREDGASMFRFDVAMGKAWASVAMGASSRVLAERAQNNPNFFITLAATADGKFLPQTGGVLIRNADRKSTRLNSSHVKIS